MQADQFDSEQDIWRLSGRDPFSSAVIPCDKMSPAAKDVNVSFFSCDEATIF